MTKNITSSEVIEAIERITPEQWKRIGRNLFDAWADEIFIRLADAMMDDEALKIAQLHKTDDREAKPL